jgi:DNA-binding NtrC family response regulator
MSNNSTFNFPILIIDDDEVSLKLEEKILHLFGMTNIFLCQDSRLAMDVIVENKIEIILLDLNMPHLDGKEMLKLIDAHHFDITVIMVSATRDIKAAVKCIQGGAFDYVVKSENKDFLRTALKRATAIRVLKRENDKLRHQVSPDLLVRPEGFEEIITNNSKMIMLFHQIIASGQTMSPVLVTGESGVGKELFVRCAHKLSQATGPFVAVNVAGLDDTMFSDTLFGHVKGAFSGADAKRSGLIEKAENGSLFMDEIGSLSMASQVKLLRLLQEGEYMPLGSDSLKHTNARFLFATNEDLWELQQKNEFRRDLNFRLRVHHINIPPLRERLDDIPLLVEHLVSVSAKKMNKQILIPNDLVDLLTTYSFPGNVRELEGMIDSAVSLSKSKTLSLDAFKEHMSLVRDRTDKASGQVTPSELFKLVDQLPTIKDITQLLIEEAIERSQGHQAKAAIMLGISQQALSKRLKKSEKPHNTTLVVIHNKNCIYA